ncbi:MAG: alpha/beta hydrolase-fold protein [Candidatus Eisenbacteria bacterium]
MRHRFPSPLWVPALVVTLLLGFGFAWFGREDSRADGARLTEDVAITFEIHVPDSTPDEAEIWISGDRAELGSWNGRGVRAEHGADGLYRAVVTFTKGTVFQFKVTRGGWDTVEKGPSGEEIANRAFRVDGPDELCAVTVANWRDQGTEPKLPSTITGDVRPHESFPSAFVEPRDVLVLLPPGYDVTSSRYSVLYMHDGQNLFDRATSFLGIEWGVDETVGQLLQAGRLDSIIVVGIDNSGTGRIFDYTPVPDASLSGGGADAYERFLLDELKPFVDREYRTLPDREHTGLAGSSLGGLVSLYIGLENPETFSRVGVVSPSVWWADRFILREVAEKGKLDLRIWLDMGSAESPGAIGEARALRDALVEEGWSPEDDLHYLEVRGAPHNESAWADRVDEMLEYLFPPE